MRVKVAQKHHLAPVLFVPNGIKPLDNCFYFLVSLSSYWITPYKKGKGVSLLRHFTFSSLEEKMEEGGALHQLVAAFKDSLPSSMGSIWGFISQPTGDIISHGSDLARSTWEMGKEHVPANNSLPSLETTWGFICQKMGEAVSQGSVLLCSTWEKISASPLPMQIVRFIQETSIATVPYAKNALDFLAESIKKHPYLFGLLVVFIMAKTCAGGGTGKMMKAPGRNYRMPRSNFEKNPGSYFRGLRGKSK